MKKTRGSDRLGGGEGEMGFGNLPDFDYGKDADADVCLDVADFVLHISAVSLSFSYTYLRACVQRDIQE